jgi:hypothetical protein
VKVKPLLGDWEVPNIAALETIERRELIELEVPGRVGSLFQDLNAAPTRIALRGSLYGDVRRDEFLAKVREQFRAGEPVTFVADILTATDVQYVLIEVMQFAEAGDMPDEMSYQLLLRESPPPPPPPDPFGGLDTSLLEQAGALVDSVTGALAALDALANLPEIQDPTPPLNGIVEGASAAVSAIGGVGSALTDLFGNGN